jgi:hypothetical protein
MCVHLSPHPTPPHSFILFQALSWSFYALCVALSLGGLLFWSSLAHRAFGLVTSFGVCGGACLACVTIQ